MSFILLSIKGVIFSKETFALFTFAKIMHSIAWLLLFLRGTIPDFVSIILGNSFLFVGWYFETSAILNIQLKNKIINKLLLSISVIGIIAFIVFSKYPGVRVGISSVISLLIFFVFMVGLFIEKTKTYLPKLIGLLSIFFCVPLLFRAAWGFSAPVSVSLKTPNIIQSVVFVTAFLVFITNSIGYLLLIKEKQEELILENEEKFSKAFYASPQSLIIYNIKKDKILEANNNFFELTHYKKDELLGKSIYDLKIWIDKSYIVEIINSEKDIILENELMLHNLKGENLIVKMTIIKYNVNNNKVVLISFRDITLQTEYEQLLMENAEKLSKLNQTKDKFVSILAHDLRSPFNIFLNYSEFLANESDKLPRDEIIEMSKMLNDSLNKQFELLTDLLSWTRLQSGNYLPQKLKFYIEPVVKKICEQLNVNASRKRIKININVNKSILIYYDEDMLKLVLRNLISNAIKFTNYEGLIIINSSCDQEYVYIEIIDNGVGIEQERLENIFSSLHSSTGGTLGEKGTGLGLMLCKEIIEKHGGEISVSSKISEGSKFNFSIPIQV